MGDTRYVSIETLQHLDVPTLDVPVEGVGVFRIAALTRQQIRDSAEQIGYDEKGAIKDAEALDVVLLAAALLEPPLDPKDPEHLALIRSLPVGVVRDLVDAMNLHSGLIGRSPKRPGS